MRTDRTPAEELKLVRELEEQHRELQSGESYFLVDKKWYVEWQQWVGYHNMDRLPTRTTSLVKSR